jgi:hypothetical protein
MKLRVRVVCALVVAACAGNTQSVPPGPVDSGETDAGDSSVGPACDAKAPWGAPVPVTGDINTAADEGAPRLLPDELTLAFQRRTVIDGGDTITIFLAARPTRTNPFALLPASILANVNAPPPAEIQAQPFLSPDGLAIYFSGVRSFSSFDIFVARRDTSTGSFGLPSPVANVNSDKQEYEPYLASDGALWLTSDRPDHTATRIYRAPPAPNGSGSSFGPSEVVAGLDANLVYPVVSDDLRTIYVESYGPNPTSSTTSDIWVATRAEPGDTFSELHPVAELNTLANDYPGWISPDNCHLYLASDRPGGAGGFDLYVASRTK